MRLLADTGAGFIAFDADDGGVSHVYVQPFPGPDPWTTVSTEEGIMPRWGRAERDSSTGSGGQMMVAPVATEPALAVGRARGPSSAGQRRGSSHSRPMLGGSSRCPSGRRRKGRWICGSSSTSSPPRAARPAPWGWPDARSRRRRRATTSLAASRAPGNKRTGPLRGRSRTRDVASTLAPTPQRKHDTRRPSRARHRLWRRNRAPSMP